MSHQAVVAYQQKRAETTRLDILRRAVDIASAEGLEGISIGRLADELAMSKTGVFAHFGSKQVLQLATVDMARDIFIAEVVEPALSSPRGLPRLGALLQAWLSYVERIVFRGGCFFAAASAEFDSRPGKVKNRIAELTKAWVVALEDEVREAQKLKQTSKTSDPRQIVFELHAYVQEANWAFKLFDDQTAFTRARSAISTRIAAETTQATPRTKKQSRGIQEARRA
jgi:AcrR family transcriptional regulator